MTGIIIMRCVALGVVTEELQCIPRLMQVFLDLIEEEVSVRLLSNAAIKFLCSFRNVITHNVISTPITGVSVY